ncbi:O-antigen ligase family protein [bacterium]|nr:O-antigen ligase family protein [bacterium]
MRLLYNKIPIVLLGVILGVVILTVPFKLAVATVLGSLVCVIILFRPDIGFLLTVSAIPFEIIGALTALGTSAGFTSISIIKILALLTSLSWLIQLSKTKVKVFFAPQYLVLIGLIIIAAASFFLVETHFEKTAKSYLIHYVIYMGIFFMTLNIVRSKELLKRLVAVLIIVGVAVSLFSFVQRWIPAFQREATTLEDDYYGLYGAIADYSEVETLGVIVRTSGGLLGHDFLALFLALTIPLTLYRLEFTKAGFLRISWVVILGIQFLALALTYSRGGAYMLIIVILLMAIRGIIKPSWEKIMIAVATLSIIVITTFATTSGLDRMFSLKHLLESDTIKSRVELIRAGLNMLKDHNWFVGVGLGNFDYNLPSYSKTIPYFYEPNNDFLRVFVEMGIFGMLFSLALFWLTFRDFRTSQKNFQKNGDLPMCNLSKTLEVCFIGFLFFSLTQTTISRKEWPLVMALAIVLKNLSTKSVQIDLKVAENLKRDAS